MGVGRKELAYAVHEVIEMPMQEWENIETCRSARVVNAVFKAITDALLRGESVHIAGFGTFVVKMKKINVCPYDPVTKKIVKGPMIYSERPIVKFLPTKHLKQFIKKNEPQAS